MNLQDLSKIDIKDLQKLDYNLLFAEVKKKPEAVVATVLVVGALIFSIGYYQQRYQELRSLRGQINVLQKKTSLITTYNTRKKEVNSFLEKLPQVIPENELINKLTDMAVHRGVKIESFSPTGGRNEKLYKTTSVRMEITAEKYQQIWLFTRDIEYSGYAMRIENWNGSLVSSQAMRLNESSMDKDSLIKVGIEITSIEVKKE
jgi:Tfp pilus assembly protein PilO